MKTPPTESWGEQMRGVVKSIEVQERRGSGVRGA